MNSERLKKLGVVVIGRNEGARLRACIDSLQGSELVSHIVYVDSGSTDASLKFCQEARIDTLALSAHLPYTAARARNEGFSYLQSIDSNLDYVQFIDGDCVVEDEWLKVSLGWFESQPDVGIVCGRRAEINPEDSLYNRFCDIEWDAGIGEVDACGGDFLCRVNAFDEVSGFNPKLIAGEEPELCFRLRAQGWTIYRIDQAMTKHDADLHLFSQWVKRAERSGWAYAQGMFTHLGTSYCKREVASVLVWVCVIPLLIALCMFTFGFAAILLASVYYIKIIQIAVRFCDSLGLRLAFQYSSFIMFAKLFQFKGIVLFVKDLILNRQSTLIEYK